MVPIHLALQCRAIFFWDVQNQGIKADILFIEKFCFSHVQFQMFYLLEQNTYMSIVLMFIINPLLITKTFMQVFYVVTF